MGAAIGGAAETTEDLELGLSLLLSRCFFFLGFLVFVSGEFGAAELLPDPASRSRSSSTWRLEGRLLRETCSPDLCRLFLFVFFDFDNLYVIFHVFLIDAITN